MTPESTTDTARAVLRVAHSRSPGLGASRLICLDGPAGSGKTTLAAEITALAVADGLGPVPVIHTDELLAGWDGGLRRMVTALVDDVLVPLAAGVDAGYRRWDWHASRFAERVPVPAGALLVVEGVGAGSRAVTAYASALVWLEADHDRRMRRGIARDGDDFAPYWHTWAEQERRHFAVERTRERADLVRRT